MIVRCEVELKRIIESLDSGVSETIHGMRKPPAAFPDPTDRANLETDRNLTLRIRDRERKLHHKAAEALVRIEQGRFGFCEICEEQIDSERLIARPVTTLCIPCKRRQEAEEERGKTYDPLRP